MDAIVILPDDFVSEDEVALVLHNDKMSVLLVHDPDAYFRLYKSPVLSSVVSPSLLSSSTQSSVSCPLRPLHRYNTIRSDHMWGGMHVIKCTFHHGDKKLLACLRSEIGVGRGIATSVYTGDIEHQEDNDCWKDTAL